MSCQEYWDNLPQRGHEITEAQSAHLSECPTCAAQAAAHRTLAAGLRSLGEDWRQSEAPQRVEAGLMAAFRAQTGYQARKTSPPSWWKPVLAWTSAAAAMIVLSVVLLHGSRPATVKPTVAAPHHTAQPTIQTAALDSDFDGDSALLGEGFVRLPNAAPIEADEEFYVVRVEAPGADMIANGISVSEDHAAETLLADVAYGSDGTPRAVRLVNEGGTY
jgi:hypothetical protein